MIKNCRFKAGWSAVLLLTATLLPAADLHWRLPGTRSLALGSGSSAFGWDPFVMLLNPALLSLQTSGLSGYQYGQDFRAAGGYDDRLSALLDLGLESWSEFDSERRSQALAGLRELADEPGGLFGIKSRAMGFVSRGYGINVQFLQGTVIGPFSGPALARAEPEVSEADLAAMTAKLANLRGTVISFGTAFRLAQGVHAGAVLHYFNGEMSLFQEGLLDGFFRSGLNSLDYFKLAVERRDLSLKKISADLGLVVEAGPHLKIGLAAHHFPLTKVELPGGELLFARRYLAGLAFQPAADWGFYLDADLSPLASLVGNAERQNLTLGLEKGFFQNQMFLRAALATNLAAEHLLGSRADLRYSFGLSFRLASISLDLAAALDREGRLDLFSAGAFFIMKQ